MRVEEFYNGSRIFLAMIHKECFYKNRKYVDSGAVCDGLKSEMAIILYFGNIGALKDFKLHCEEN